ncbi:MAG: hypothetical protein JSS82_18795 [Bacteroidetes bacterium]|nr:hypothetical protein [Bacteroidota bacterium]
MRCNHSLSSFCAAVLILIATACNKPEANNNKINIGPPRAAAAAYDYNADTSLYKDTVFTNYFKRQTGLIAGDAAFSVPQNNGKSMWLFGDSYIDNYDPVTATVPCLFQVRNCGLLMDIANPAVQTTYTGIASPPSYFHLGTDNSYWFWPGAGYTINDTMVIFLERLHSTGNGPFDFAVVDSNYIAKVPVANPSLVSYQVQGSHNGIDFTKSVINDPSFCGFTMIYGIKTNGFGNDVFLARFPSDNVNGLWQYYTDNGWVNDPALAKAIYSEFTSSFYVVKVKEKYVMISTEFSVGCDQGKNVYVSVSNNPYGPFTNHHSVWQVDDTLNGHYPMFYMAMAHPEFDNGHNQLLITYCINGYGNCVSTCINNRMDPNTYRPKAIRVGYKKIDPSL